MAGLERYAAGGAPARSSSAMNASIRSAAPQAAPGFVEQLFAGSLRRKRRLVWTLRRERVEDVDDAHDLGEQRNGVSFEAVRIAAAVEQLVMVAHDRAHLPERPQLSAQMIADHGVQLDLLRTRQG